MLSFIRIEKLEDQFAFCELEMRWVSESKSIGRAPARYEHVYALRDEFRKFGKIKAGEVFTALHNNGRVLCVVERDQEEQANRFAKARANAKS